MRKSMLIVLLLTVCILSACGRGNTGVIIGGSDSTESPDKIEEETEMDTENRTTVANALGVEETERNIRFILSALNTIEAGTIRLAEKTEQNGESVLYIVAEDGTEYRIHLTGGGSVSAVQNLSTGEWPIKSMR